MKWLGAPLKQEATLRINPFLPLIQHTQFLLDLQTSREGGKVEITVKSNMELSNRYIF